MTQLDDVGRCASRRSAALRAEPVALSQAKPAAAIAGASVAQLVEHPAFNRKVAGSTPARCTNE